MTCERFEWLQKREREKKKAISCTVTVATKNIDMIHIFNNKTQ